MWLVFVEIDKVCEIEDYCVRGSMVVYVNFNIICKFCLFWIEEFFILIVVVIGSSDGVFYFYGCFFGGFFFCY